MWCIKISDSIHWKNLSYPMWICVYMLSHFIRVQLFATLWTVAHQDPLPMGFSRQEYWNGSPCPPPRNLPDPGIKPVSLTSPALAGRFLYHFSLTDYLGFKSWFCHILSWWPWTNQFPSASLYTFLKWV